jgi:hypothetical protein
MFSCFPVGRPENRQTRSLEGIPKWDTYCRKVHLEDENHAIHLRATLKYWRPWSMPKEEVKGEYNTCSFISLHLL